MGLWNVNQQRSESQLSLQGEGGDGCALIPWVFSLGMGRGAGLYLVYDLSGTDGLVPVSVETKWKICKRKKALLVGSAGQEYWDRGVKNCFNP